ncbi:N-acetyltransferase [Arthrobacter psychrolactophilus]|uniref:N-acetyltransferase n=1 Tax=Arthrobacter psychrolactophilus TaxID=92442 RepID=A0A2V5IM65_9MICC|nr:GNAT family N-acetyltransferase [Arthrobacter psychrolactophilus]PYI37211.1 N-acetyltransferase [Arthrobacter psychrolactophilus]
MRAPTTYPAGPRIAFREFTPSDTAAVHEYASDPEVTRWSTWGPNTVEQTAAFVEHAAQAQLQPERSAYSLAAIVDQQLIASVGIWVTDPHDRNGELGYTVHRAHWGQGYASEAVQQLLRIGFDTLGLERITATCHPENAASVRVLEKNRFTLEGRLRAHRIAHGTRRDSLLFSILREEFREAS